MLRIQRINYFPYLLILPLILLVSIFRYYPALLAFYSSFTDWDGISSAHFVGISNYISIFTDDSFLASLKNIIFYLFAGIATTILIPFIGAELVYEIGNPQVRNFWKMIFILPMLLPRSVLYRFWGIVYDPVDGVLNRLLKSLHLGDYSQNFLGDPNSALLWLLLIGFPFLGGIGFILYISALEAIPKEVCEAVRLDGCSAFRRILQIDIGFIRGPSLFLLIIAILGSLQISEQQLVLTRGGPAHATESMGYYLFRSGFEEGELGLGNAAGVIIFLLGIIASYISVKNNYRKE